MIHITAKGVLAVFLVIVLGGIAVLPVQVGQAQFGQPAGRPAVAQGASITIEGVLQSVTADTWVVGGANIKITPNTTITGHPVVGSVVRIVVTTNSDQTFVAVSVVVIVLSGTAEPTEAETEQPEPTEAETEEVTPARTVEPTEEPTVEPTGQPTVEVSGGPFVTIIIEGPVEQVNVSVNVIVVFGQRIRLRDDDPLRLKVKVGDWVHVKGHFDEDENHQVIIVAVVVVIFNAPPVVVIQPGNPGGNGNGQGDDHHHEDDD